MNTLVDAQALRSLRESKRWDQQTLAHAAGIDPSVVSRLERGLQTDLKASILVALANALDVSVDALLSASGRHIDGTPIPELAAVMTELLQLPEPQQRQVAAILRAYLSSLP